MRISRRRLLQAVATSAVLLSPAAMPRARAERASRRLVLNDASRLNPTPIAAQRFVRTDDDRRYVEDVRALLRDAAKQGTRFVSAGHGTPWAARVCPETGSRRR